MVIRDYGCVNINTVILRKRRDAYNCVLKIGSIVNMIKIRDKYKLN